MALDFVVGAVASALVYFAFRLLRVAFLSARGDLNIYERNRGRVQSLSFVINGKVRTKYDGTRDDLVAAGVAINNSNNTWIEQGRLSDEALQDALYH